MFASEEQARMVSDWLEVAVNPSPSPSFAQEAKLRTQA